MAFPKYKITKEGDRRPVGWEDLGAVIRHEPNQSQYSCNEILVAEKICTTCLKTVRMGKEKGKTFTYCPECLIKNPKFEIRFNY